jgi:aldehyde dehydrogenase (NAD+)
MMQEYRKFYIDGRWVDPVSAATIEVVDPVTETAFARIAAGNAADVDRAVAAARRAFDRFQFVSPRERRELLQSIVAQWRRRREDLAQAVTSEIGAPITLSRAGQVDASIDIVQNMANLLATFRFETELDGTLILKEPIGVVGVITPWNWPLQQIARKVGAAIAAGCTCVMKPSEITPVSALIFAELMHDAGVPAGVFNLVNGDGLTVGSAITAHPGVDMVTFTGSTRAGIQIARSAADTVKRVHQELGGKSANIIFDDVDLETVVARDVQALMRNTGQTCNAPTRMLVQAGQHDRVADIAAAAANRIVIGDPRDEATEMGPLASRAQFDKVQRMIGGAIQEGARLMAGGPGRPEGFERGFYARPTILASVTEDMTCAREEIFGPVLVILPYADEEDAIRIANNSEYGLAAYLSTDDPVRARRVAGRLRAGNIHLNGTRAGPSIPFGGYKQSGNGREKGPFGLEEFLEIKAVIGHAA